MKRNLIQLSEEYDIEKRKLYEIIGNLLEEEMVTGRYPLIWVNEDGQAILNDQIPMPILRRGKVLRECPNKKFVYVENLDAMCRVPVRIPTNRIGKLIGKNIYFEELNKGNETTYTYSRG